MIDLLSTFQIEIPKGIYLKDPESSALGKRIIESSIVLIKEQGFEDFNFKKLGEVIQSNESSIYRYFESKHKLLVYLTSWYWSWIECQLIIETYSNNDAEDKLKKAIYVVSRTAELDHKYGHIDEVFLNQIIIHENSKSYLTKNVDLDNKEGAFMPYKRVIHRLAEIISEYNSKYPNALSLASTIVEGALHQHFIKNHFKSITNCNETHSPSEFYIDLTLKTLVNEK
ncbi:TetR/AcrR family transcriptional regulator [Formosa algae]|uniref:AcrR family transcriptional regulator n=1 Tax=Formosa algae TaxID=225843 RepID=A0A9X1C9F1_9FLAO|nr:TetR/AcrR family transcriptional regulator [Formosa algae]MBP1840976.1 AcrR family transcriptional regulator [Formosa algae]MDQ0336127.1 AcrR family transcriptional regulator [Formosa algae]OEI79914.1 TetR family transcriptional regulator [Formosa algae]PNW26379.1 TetR family transcriptional regulator [Formosa algae]